MKDPIGGRLDRRRFVQVAAGTVAAAVSLPFPGLARVIAPGPVIRAQVGASDPGFWSGQVTAKDALGLIVSSDLGWRRVAIRPGKSIWREFPVSIDEAYLGDAFTARGDPQPDGSLAAWPGWAWLNIGRWDGTIRSFGNDRLVAERSDGLQRTILFSTALEVIRAAKQVPVPGGVQALAIGMRIGCVGLRLPDFALRATRIWID